jgi:hypothetical protein
MGEAFGYAGLMLLGIVVTIATISLIVNQI